MVSGRVFDIFGAATRKYNDDVKKTPRPFDRDMDGLVVAEGAGIVILEEAGGKVSKFDGSEFSVYDKEIVASNGQIHEEFLSVLKG